jgi:hypothetical protein
MFAVFSFQFLVVLSFILVLGVIIISIVTVKEVSEYAGEHVTAASFLFQSCHL